MIPPIHFGAAGSGRRLSACLLCCLLGFTCGAETFAQAEAASGQAGDGAVQQAPPPTEQDTAAKPGGASGTPAAVGAHAIEPTANKRQLREAEEAYLAGAKKLEHDDLNAAESEFQRALKLDPANPDYAVAISVTREHRLTELVQQATKARLAGNAAKAETLLATARAIDPKNPIVAEHSGPFYVRAPQPAGALPSQAAPGKDTGSIAAATLVDRSKLIAGAMADDSSKPQAPVLAGAIHVTPTKDVKSFHLRGNSADVLRQVAAAYGINAAVDDSVEPRNVRFDLEDVTYQTAMDLLLSMTHAFVVPLDPTGILVARDDSANRQRLEPQLQETIQVPGYTTAQINELVNVIKNIFNVKQIEVQANNLVVRAPEDVLDPLNETLQSLIGISGQVMIEVRVYEIDRTNMTNVGGNLPTQFSVFNVDQQANQIVSSNQTLVQQAVAQGLVPAGTSNLQIALALINLGLVQNSLAANLIGVFGGGAFMTGLSGPTSTTFNLGLNSSDTRELDDMEQRVGDREAGMFRLGTRYPIITSTYTSGLSTAGSSLANASINGVNVASLLQQYAGGSSVTIPQVTYEDLGVTLKTTPTIQRSGRINIKLDLKIESLSGTTSDGNPVLDNRQFTSVLTVGEGETALMVSAVSKTEIAALTGIPGLSELPGFQMPTEANVEHDETQLVVMVTPYIISRPPELLSGPRIPLHAQN